jgi:hypothetical protein
LTASTQRQDFNISRFQDINISRFQDLEILSRFQDFKVEETKSAPRSKVAHTTQDLPKTLVVIVAAIAVAAAVATTLISLAVEATGAAAVGIAVATAIAIASEVVVVVIVVAATAALALLLLSSLLLLRTPNQKYSQNLLHYRSFDAQTLRSIEGAGGRGATFRIVRYSSVRSLSCALLRGFPMPFM